MPTRQGDITFSLRVPRISSGSKELSSLVALTATWRAERVARALTPTLPEGRQAARPNKARQVNSPSQQSRRKNIFLFPLSLFALGRYRIAIQAGGFLKAYMIPPPPPPKKKKPLYTRRGGEVIISRWPWPLLRAGRGAREERTTTDEEAGAVAELLERAAGE